MSAMSDIDDVQRLIKSGRWIDVGELLTAQRQAKAKAAWMSDDMNMFHNIPTEFDTETGDMIILNSTDLIMKKYKITVYNKIDKTVNVMNTEIKTMLAQILHTYDHVQEGNLKDVLERMLGTDEFAIEVQLDGV